MIKFNIKYGCFLIDNNWDFRNPKIIYSEKKKKIYETLKF